MSTTKDETKKFGDTHPIGQILDDWSNWVKTEGKGDLSITYDEDEDIFALDRDGRKAVLYLSDIDEDFYGEAQAVFVESEIGEPPTNLDWSQTLKFSGNELVLSRISLTDRNGKTILLVESATPTSQIAAARFDLMVKEVATIAKDLRKHLAGVLKTTAQDDDLDDEDEDGDDDE